MITSTTSSEYLNFSQETKLDKELRAYYKTLGIRVREPSPGTGFGAGPGDFQLLLLIMNGLIKLAEFLTTRAEEKHQAAVQPTYRIILLCSNSHSYCAESEGEVGDLIGEVLYYGWLGQRYLSNKYPGIGFTVWTRTSFKKYLYSVDYHLLKIMNVKDASHAVRIARSLKIRVDTYELVKFGASLFVTLERFKAKQMKLTFLKYDRLIHASLRTRGLEKHGPIKGMSELVRRR